MGIVAAVWLTVAVLFGAAGSSPSSAPALLMPGHGVGPVALGMDESQVGRVLGAPRISEGDARHFGTLAVVLDREGKVAVVMLVASGQSEPAGPEWVQAARTKGGVGLGAKGELAVREFGEPDRETVMGEERRLVYKRLGIELIVDARGDIRAVTLRAPKPAPEN